MNLGLSLYGVRNTGFKRDSYYVGMRTVVRSSVDRFSEKSCEETGKSAEDEIEGYEMMVGHSCDSKEARNDFIDEVENLLEFESLRRGQQHSRKNFENAAAQSEMFELQKR